MVSQTLGFIAKRVRHEYKLQQQEPIDQQRLAKFTPSLVLLMLDFTQHERKQIFTEQNNTKQQPDL